MPSPQALQGRQRARYVHDLFARVASHYDVANGLITLGMHGRWRRRTVRWAAPLLPARTGERPPRGDRPLCGLDLCCGTGDYVFLLRERLGADARLVGLDFCEPMLRKAAERARRRGSGEGTVWMVGDATDLSFFRDGVFDIVTVGFGLRNIVDLPAALKEAARVLRPGGVFVSLELSPPRGGPLRPLILAYLRWLLPALVRMAKGGREDYLWLRRSLEAFPDPAGLSGLLEASGFEVVRVGRFGFRAIAAHIARRV